MAPSSAVPRGTSPTDDVGFADAPTGRAAERRLCAGAYLDREFRDRALREVYGARGKRAAPSHGFDIVPVLWHARRAWRLETGQHLLTLAVLATGLAIAPLDTVIAVDLLAIWRLLRLWTRWAAQFVGYGEPVDSPALDQMNLTRDRRLRLNGKVLKYSLWFAVAMLPLLALVSELERRTGSTSARLAGTGLGVGVIVIALAAVVSGGAVAHAVCLERSQSATARPGRLNRRLESIDRQQRHPIVVHTGHEPFIGSGKAVGNWSFAQRLVTKDRAVDGKAQEFDRPPFPARKLIDRLKDSISELGEDEDPETRLPELKVTDWIFVHGAHASPSLDRVLTSDQDGYEVNNAIDEAIANPGEAARHYLAARVESWGGDLVTSVFVHVSLQGRTLYLEFATHALFPVKAEYEAPWTGPRAVAGDVGRALLSLPERLMDSWRVIRMPALLIPVPRGADAGTEISLRETAMVDSEVKFWDEPESSYFQVQDVAQHSKIIERRLLATVEDFLHDVGVDTSEFVQRSMQILNNGVINTGSGEVNITNSAVGQNSSVNQ